MILIVAYIEVSSDALMHKRPSCQSDFVYVVSMNCELDCILKMKFNWLTSDVMIRKIVSVRF